MGIHQIQSADSNILLESMSESILITTPELDLPGPYIIYVNKAFEKMTGWTRDEILGKNPRFLQGPNTDLGIFHDLRNILSKGKVWKGQTINYKKDGTEFFMEWSIAPVYDENGVIQKLMAVQRDITENVRIKNELETKDTAKLLEEKHFELIPSVTESTTNLLFVEAKRKTSGELN